MTTRTTKTATYDMEWEGPNGTAGYDSFDLPIAGSFEDKTKEVRKILAKCDDFIDYLWANDVVLNDIDICVWNDEIGHHNLKFF